MDFKISSGPELHDLVFHHRFHVIEHCCNVFALDSLLFQHGNQLFVMFIAILYFLVSSNFNVKMHFAS